VENPLPANVPKETGNDGGGNSCLSCGVPLNSSKRRYCSIDCRQRLRRKLNLRTGLLRALNTRYATFYITEHAIVLDVMLFDASDIFSFIFARTPGRQPAEDFSRLADRLGNAWWAERRQTRKKYLASRHVLEKAVRGHVKSGSVTPQVAKNPLVTGASLIHLQLKKSDLDSSDLEKRIKSAYRLQAKRHHPDMGGDSKDFRKIRLAYEELIRWSENPVFSKRRGFPDKWFYSGYTHQWVQPTPSRQ